jgi:hypothetical protein
MPRPTTFLNPAFGLLPGASAAYARGFLRDVMPIPDGIAPAGGAAVWHALRPVAAAGEGGGDGASAGTGASGGGRRGAARGSAVAGCEIGDKTSCNVRTPAAAAPGDGAAVPGGGRRSFGNAS